MESPLLCRDRIRTCYLIDLLHPILSRAAFEPMLFQLSYLAAARVGFEPTTFGAHFILAVAALIKPGGFYWSALKADVI